jgi:hypothetical protein
VQRFPNHTVSLILKSALPNYEVWAAAVRTAVAEREEMEGVDQVENLNAASQASGGLPKLNKSCFTNTAKPYQISANSSGHSTTTAANNFTRFPSLERSNS